MEHCTGTLLSDWASKNNEKRGRLSYRNFERVSRNLSRGATVYTLRIFPIIFLFFSPPTLLKKWEKRRFLAGFALEKSDLINSHRSTIGELSGGGGRGGGSALRRFRD